MEVFLKSRMIGDWTCSLLHVRGGVSEAGQNACVIRQSSPRPWRCFHRLLRQSGGSTVFSTSVEVFLEIANRTDRPHRSSPRPWRCFLSRSACVMGELVFSTSVEVFPRAGALRMTVGSLLHVRGGVSLPRSLAIVCSASSPRPWRCFRFSRGLKTAIFVFSTSVEVFPIEKLAGR